MTTSGRPFPVRSATEQEPRRPEGGFESSLSCRNRIYIPTVREVIIYRKITKSSKEVQYWLRLRRYLLEVSLDRVGSDRLKFMLNDRYFPYSFIIYTPKAKSSTMPKVSVVIPTHNRASHVGRAIESVTSQDFRDTEVIVVDDGSTDDTESVVKSIDDPRIRYLAHDTNRGGSAARNTGIKESSGEYVAFLDDDDEWLPQKLRRQVNCLENRSEDWVAVYCDYDVVRNEDDPVNRIPDFVLDYWPGKDSDPQPEGGSELIPRMLATDMSTGGASTLMVKEDAVDAIGGFDPEFERHQDWEFLIRLVQVGKLAFVDEPLVRKHGTGYPSESAVEQGKRALFSRFSSEIEEAERKGYDITGIHQFHMAKLNMMNGHFVKGARRLPEAKVEMPGLLRSVFIGLHSALSS